jgi:diaminopimelate epimerase
MSLQFRKMPIAFRKMHGAGNDFVIVDTRGRPNLSEQEARALADRRLGIGCDQVIGLELAEISGAGQGPDIFMRIRNPDGSEAGACGNATRCVAELLRETTGRTALTIRTIAGDLPATYQGQGRWSVDMGEPRLTWRDVPLADPTDTLAVPLAIEDLPAPAALSMGNPHATFFVDDLTDTDIPRLGPILEHAPIFPERANIGFAQILAPDAKGGDRIRLRVWERGAGLTLACGSGACAALVNAARRGLTARAATLLLDGGELRIEWRDDGHVIMTGPTATAFTGTIELPAIELAA